VAAVVSTLSTHAGTAPGSRLALVFDVFKLRIGLVIAVTALAGMAVTPGPEIAAWHAIALFTGVALSAAAAGAFNQFVERDLDARMSRTRHRAFVTGRLAHDARWPLAMAALAIAGVALVAWASNAWAALYSALGALTYGVVYTVVLKRRTPWNIVLGGTAGSFAVLAGAAAVAPELTALPLAFALVLFLWTPPHFWSLAIACRDDYAAAGVPMLPVVIGSARAARVVLAGTVLLVAASLLPCFFGMGPWYLAGALAGGAAFLRTSLALARSPTRGNAMRNFHLSLLQLSMLLAASFVDVAVRS
jgi:protoheme IX farnesyltransferase